MRAIKTSAQTGLCRTVTNTHKEGTMLELITSTRSFRRFDESRRISGNDMEALINLARLGGSARNCQPWQFMGVTDPELCLQIFPYLAWAGYLSDWKGPEEGERPSAYIICFLNKDWHKGALKEAWFDLGTATQNMLLGAMEKNIGGCRIGAFSPRLEDIFEIPEHLELSLIVALGHPVEKVVLDTVPEKGDIRYWRDQHGVHHVPKRSLKEVKITLKMKK